MVLPPEDSERDKSPRRRTRKASQSKSKAKPSGGLPLGNVPAALEKLEKVNINAAGIDIGAGVHYVAVPEGRDLEASVRCFRSFTRDLEAIADWLEACGVTTVAMESTGVYWIPLYELLQRRGFEVLLAEASQVKKIRRKTDVLDCQWIQTLHMFGLLSGSFRPDDKILELRGFMRQRDMLIKYASDHVRHMQKALQQMNVKLTEVVSDITGLTGMSIIKAILAGERAPHALAKLRHENCKNDEATIALALHGNWRIEHLVALQQAVALFEFYQQQLGELDEHIETHLRAHEDVGSGKDLPRRPKRRRDNREPSFDMRNLLYRMTAVDLTDIDGIGGHSALQIISEIGQEALRWWDYWLKGDDSGVMREPLLRYYQMHGAEVGASCEFRVGQWRAETSWPPKRSQTLTFGLRKGSLVSGSSARQSLDICSPMHTGVDGGEYCPMAWGADLPGDQRRDDAGSLCFDTAKFRYPFAIVGGAYLDLTFSVDRPVAFVAARLCDINPSGFSTRITLGLCNLNHLRGSEKPQRLVPGRKYKIRVHFGHTAYQLPKGHRLRLALSTQYWPLVMSSPELVTLTVHTAATRLSVPRVHSKRSQSVSFETPECGPSAKRTIISPATTQRTTYHDVETGKTTYRVCEESDDVKIQSHGAQTYNRTTRVYTIAQDDPASATMESHRTRQLSRGSDFVIRTEARTKLASTAKTFELESTLEAFENDTSVFKRRWCRSYPRGHH